MAELFSNKSRLERRLKELRKESGLVKEDIRALSRALREPDELEQLPRLKSGRYDRRVPVRPPSRPDPVSPPPAAQPPPSHVSHAAHPAYSMPLSHTMPPKVSAMAAGGLAEPRGTAAPRKVVEGDGRFRKLFSSGGFFGTAHYRQEQNVQRNKAVFMLMIVAVFLMIVYRLIFQ